MAKLIIAAALVVALLALTAEASYRTTITTTVIEDNPRQQQEQQCREQLQGRQLRQCQMYLSSQQSRGRQDDELALRSFLNPGVEQQRLQQCCEQLRSIDNECRCEAIRKVAMKHQQEAGRYQGQETQQIMRAARELPSRCNMDQPRECQIRAVLV